MTIYTIATLLLWGTILAPLFAGVVAGVAAARKGGMPGVASLGLVALAVGQMAGWAFWAQATGGIPQDAILALLSL